MVKFIIYVLTAIIVVIAVSIFGKIEIDPQDVVNTLAIAALLEICKHTEKNEREV